MLGKGRLSPVCIAPGNKQPRMGLGWIHGEHGQGAALILVAQPLSQLPADLRASQCDGARVQAKGFDCSVIIGKAVLQ